MSTSLYRRKLPLGWYPDTQNGIENTILSWQKGDSELDGAACIVPHAGWFFSGELAYRTYTSLAVQPDIIVIAGGHLSPGDNVLLMDYDEFETPLGNLENASALISYIKSHGMRKIDRFTDNTVEIQLPLIKKCFPHSTICCVRIPPNAEAEKLAALLYEYQIQNDQKIFIVGSTDLTHYGPQYHFDLGLPTVEALSWVMEKNDREFIDACTHFDSEALLEKSLNDRAACSPGAALCAIKFAALQKNIKTKLIAYDTSYAKHKSDSFVGYVGIIFY